MTGRTLICALCLLAAPAAARAQSAIADLGLTAGASPAVAVSAPRSAGADKSSEIINYSHTASNPVDSAANAAARGLYARLRAGYGRQILSGHTTQRFGDLVRVAGQNPVVRGFDMQNYSPRNPWHSDWSSWDDGTVQEAINWHNSTGGRGIVTFQWHWFSPSGGRLERSTFYTRDTSFDVSRAVISGTTENREVLRDLDAIAAQLLRLQEAGVPVLWRPLHEAGGRWFWWGARGPEAAKALYDLMYDRFTRHHGLHNLLWVWSTPEWDWYPGNAKVDIIGYDSYPIPFMYFPQKSMFDRLHRMVGDGKMIAMTEAGALPSIEWCFSSDAKWLYIMNWNEKTFSDNTDLHLAASYADERFTTLDRVR